MSDKPKTVAEAKAALAKVEREASAVAKRIKILEVELADLRERQRDLCGGFHSNGRVGVARRVLEEAERYEADETLPVVVWKSRKVGEFAHGMVVCKVTPKAITIRRPGHLHAYKFHHDGTSYQRWLHSVIDITATFPDGLKVTKEKRRD